MTQYVIPSQLNDFQRSMYLQLCEWKSRNITPLPGSFGGPKYDVILPGNVQQALPHLYGPVRGRFRDHLQKFHLKTHKFAGHMASSQIACANLFLPLMEEPLAAARILSVVKPDVRSIAVDELDQGFRLEFGDEGANRLGDHGPQGGTGADIAIAYRNQDDELCLWLIEHKLTETEFTACGAYRSQANQHKDDCDANAAARLGRENCYYHSAKRFNYWDITLKHKDIFPVANLQKADACPFKGGLNQLWRNQLLAAAIETDPNGRFKKAFSSVVYHPGNAFLLPSLQAFANLVDNNNRFTWFSSAPILEAAQMSDNGSIKTWAKWYRELYFW